MNIDNILHLENMYKNQNIEKIEEEIIKEIKLNKNNHDLWLLLAATTQSEVYQKKCLNAAITLFKKNYNSKFEYKLDDDENSGTFETRIVGISYNNRAENIKKLRIKERVILEKEVNNKFDKNAIQVKNIDNESLGYISKSIAAKLSPYFNFIKNDSINALVTEIICDSSGEDYGVKIAFKVPIMYVDEDSESSFTIFSKQDEYSGNIEATYLLINSSNQLFNKLKNIILDDLKLDIISKGISTKTTPIHNKYRWYIRFNNLENSEKELLQDYLNKKLNILTEDELKEKQNKYYIEQLDELQKDLLNKDKTLKKYEKELSKSDKNKFLNDEFLEYIDSENLEKDQKIISLKEEINILKARESILSFRINLAQENLSLNAESEDVESSEIDKLFKSFNSISEIKPKHIIKIFQKSFPNKLIFLDSAYNSSKRVSNFNHIDKIFQKFWLLSTSIYQYFKESGQANCTQSLCQYWDYAPNMGNISPERQQRITFEYKNKKYYMEKHLKIGFAENPNETLRIHFEWNKDEERIIIGYCGKHI